jgi:Glycosyl transferase family 2
MSSVLSQDVQDLRLLIIDNASTDDSVAIARQRPKTKEYQVALHPANLGLLSSFNEAIDWTSSKYFAPMRRRSSRARFTRPRHSVDGRETRGGPDAWRRCAFQLGRIAALFGRN